MQSKNPCLDKTKEVRYQETAMLHGSCHCGAVRFSVMSSTPVPYQECYCSICRKTAGGGGYAINLGAHSKTMKIEGKEHTRIYHAKLRDDKGKETTSSAERHFCGLCGTHLWLYDSQWPELIHPLASCIDTDLPVPPEKVRLMLKYKANWVEVPREDLPEGPGFKHFQVYPQESIEDWHKRHGMYQRLE